MKDNQFDVVIVGARIAGCAAAIEFAHHGLKVLLLDQARFPSDTLSIHFRNSRGYPCSHWIRERSCAAGCGEDSLIVHGIDFYVSKV